MDNLNTLDNMSKNTHTKLFKLHFSGASGNKMNNARKPCVATVFGHFLFCSVPHSYQFQLSNCYHTINSVRISAISLCLFGYKCEYVLRVVFISSCPKRSPIESGDIFNSIKWLAWLWRNSCTFIFHTPESSQYFRISLCNDVLLDKNSLFAGLYSYKCPAYSFIISIIGTGNATMRLLFSVLVFFVVCSPSMTARLLLIDTVHLSKSKSFSVRASNSPIRIPL